MWNLTSKSLIIIRSVFFLQRHEMYLKILFLKKCETNTNDIKLQVSTIILLLFGIKKTIKNDLKLRILLCIRKVDKEKRKIYRRNRK